MARVFFRCVAAASTSVAGVLLVFACAKAPTAPAAPPATAHVATTSAELVNAEVAPSSVNQASESDVDSVELVFERTRPQGAPACVLQGVPWLPHDEEAALSLRPGGPGFVHVTMIGARIEIPIGKAHTVFVEMESDGWHVAGHFDASVFTLSPLRVVQHDGVMLASELSNLKLVDAQLGRLLLTLEPPPVLRLAAPAVPQMYICEDVNVGPPPQLFAESQLPGDPKKRTAVRLQPKQVPLSIVPGSPPDAWLDVTDELTFVELERKNDYRRVALTHYTTLVFGWVSKREVVTLPPAGDEVSGVGGLGLGSFSGSLEKKEPPSVRCDSPLPIMARVGTDMMQVGSVDAGTAIITTNTNDGWAEVLPPSSLALAAGARFVAPGSEVARCKPSLWGTATRK